MNEFYPVFYTTTVYGYAHPGSDHPVPNHGEGQPVALKDYGPEPFGVNIREATLQNKYFRTTLWTGQHLQLTLMCINPGEDIGLEAHPDVDQFIRVEQGQGMAMMGDAREYLPFRQSVYPQTALFIPAGKWHNLYNTGDVPLKLYSIYAPPEHPWGTVHPTKEDDVH